MPKPISQNDWEWFGRAGHYICGRWCRFHLCTKVGKYLISSVGEYVHPRHGKGIEQAEAEWLQENWPGEDIGYDRKYETMVFFAGKRCIEPDCNCGQPTHDGGQLECEGYNTAKDATIGHMEMCRKYAVSYYATARE